MQAVAEITKYSPAFDALTLDIIGLTPDDVKPFGPIQEKLLPLQFEQVNERLLPSHKGEFAESAAGLPRVAAGIV